MEIKILETIFTSFREEEKLRMLNHILKQLDKNGDSLVSLQEFLEVCDFFF